ncbi:MAG: DNA replication/repair protein RecF [Actinomycetales bacterium]|nr:DNA replication/repair protein RecF [Actinomycetales bacterium]
MWVSGLRLTDFRSYEHAELTLSPGVTTLVGANGQGKTNVVEAVGYASTLGSHRVSSDAPLVRAGAERAVISVQIVRHDRQALIELEINPGRSNRARINRGTATRARDVLGILRTVVFAPEDLSLVKGDPSDRRRFLDELIIQRAPRLQGVKSDYDRILKQRNALLKSAGQARRIDPVEVGRTLEVWDEQLATVGGELCAERVALVRDMQPWLVAAYALIAGGGEAVSSADVRVAYASAVPGSEEFGGDRTAWRQGLLDAVAARRRDELDRGITLVGPHRDELELTIGPHPAKGYASHGESWSLALALRLAAFDVLTEDGDEPVLILDDVFAELDALRRRRLGERIASASQVLLTAAVPEDVPPTLAGARFLVTRGTVTPA